MSSEQEFSPEKSFHVNEQIWSQAFYRNGKLEGEYKEWWDNGNICICSFYRNGNLDGEYKEWYVNGGPFEYLFYRDGKREGKHKVWYYNGQLWIKEHFRDGNREGKCKSWQENGRPWSKQFYKNGRATAEGKFYSGKLIGYHSFTSLDEIIHEFSLKKKMNLLRVKRKFLSRTVCSTLSDFLIKDLFLDEQSSFGPSEK
jgi:uncharacterized protein